ncbi:hypothetical protein H4219_004987 [Mycoemilia scoparia]|uniref:Uncharacterized protein n=1 Tax=Mycoemilia scoparia TaxID=417184 RepID=A0A9W8DQE4_9FUNG|nr:hypothetical protein H4219_004987 [Mycoemilia scoparia]
MVTAHNFPKISACIFDMDGLLLDTEDLYTQATNAILAPYGKTLIPRVKTLMMGRDNRTSTDILIRELGLDITFEEYDGMAMEMKIATGSHREMFEIKTANHKDVFNLFGHVVCGDDPAVKKSKPAPDCFLVALKRFSNPPPPEEIIVFEDAVNGVCAGTTAGMNAKSRFTSQEVIDKNEYGAIEILKSLEDFDPKKYGLPAY